MGKTDLYLYLISHNRKDIKTHTYIGCVEDFVNRLNQHNGIVAGGPRVTRRAAGSWEPVLVLKLPKERSFDAKLLKKEWKTSSLGAGARLDAVHQEGPQGKDTLAGQPRCTMGGESDNGE